MVDASRRWRLAPAIDRSWAEVGTKQCSSVTAPHPSIRQLGCACSERAQTQNDGRAMSSTPWRSCVQLKPPCVPARWVTFHPLCVGASKAPARRQPSAGNSSSKHRPATRKQPSNQVSWLMGSYIRAAPRCQVPPWQPRVRTHHGPTGRSRQRNSNGKNTYHSRPYW